MSLFGKCKAYELLEDSRRAQKEYTSIIETRLALIKKALTLALIMDGEKNEKKGALQEIIDTMKAADKKLFFVGEEKEEQFYQLWDDSYNAYIDLKDKKIKGGRACLGIQ